MNFSCMKRHPLFRRRGDTSAYETDKTAARLEEADRREVRNWSGRAGKAKFLSWRRHGVEEFHVVLGLGQAAEEQLHGLDGRERAENLAQYPDAAQFVWREQQF